MDQLAPPRSAPRRSTSRSHPSTSPRSPDAASPLVQDQPDTATDARALWIAQTLAESPPITAPVAARIAFLLTPVYQRTTAPTPAV